MFHRLVILSLLSIITIENSRADQITFAYEGDVLPSDPSSGLEVFNACDHACSAAIQDGFLSLSWQSFAAGDRDAYFAKRISPNPSDPPPNPFWVEWRFASNFPLGPNFYDSDGKITIDSHPIGMILNMYGDAIISQDGGHYVAHLELNAFRTFRFETLDGLNYCVWYDGNFFACDQDGINAPGSHLIVISGEGGDDPNFSFPAINRWDYVRYGTMTTGEAIVSSDPPGGSVSAMQHQSFDRFTVTFDQPNYVHVDEVSVQASSGPVPQVTKTRRQDNGPPETVEIVLDQPMQLGATYTFTFATGGTPNTVTYTLVQGGACCHADGSCTEAIETDCTTAGGSFSSTGTCSTPSACCLSDGSCRNLAAVCCSLSGGTLHSNDLCEGDADHDGIDGMCGDTCPNDPENDIDADGLCADVDPCPTLNPNDVNQNGIPDCQEPTAIPTINQWGLTILVLSLLIAAKVSQTYQHLIRA